MPYASPPFFPELSFSESSICHHSLHGYQASFLTVRASLGRLLTTSVNKENGLKLQVTSGNSKKLLKQFQEQLQPPRKHQEHVRTHRNSSGSCRSVVSIKLRHLGQSFKHCYASTFALYKRSCEASWEPFGLLSATVFPNIPRMCPRIASHKRSCLVISRTHLDE